MSKATHQIVAPSGIVIGRYRSYSAAEAAMRHPDNVGWDDYRIERVRA